MAGMAEPRKSAAAADATPRLSPQGEPSIAPPGARWVSSGVRHRSAPSDSPLEGVDDIGLPFSGEIGTQLREFIMLSRAFERQMGEALAVNPTDLSAMEHLIAAGSLTPSELARRLDISTAATTLVVDRLVGVGHAHRDPHVSDRRKVVVTPAPASVARAVQELMPVIGRVATLARGLSPEERVVISRFLGQVLDIYRDSLDVTAR